MYHVSRMEKRAEEGEVVSYCTALMRSSQLARNAVIPMKWNTIQDKGNNTIGDQYNGGNNTISNLAEV